MNKISIIIGILLIIGGSSGIYFVTFPSIMGIGDNVENIIDGQEISESVVSTIIGVIILYFTTGIFIAILSLGGILSFMGVSKN